MLAVNYTTLRDNMKDCFDQIADSCEPMIVTRKSENMVIMSQGTYDSLMETLYLAGNRNNYEHLLYSIAQHKASDVNAHDLIEVPDDTMD